LNPQKTNARRGYYSRVAKRREKLATSGQIFKDTPKEGKMNQELRKFLVAGILSFTVICVGLCVLTGFAGYLFTRPTVTIEEQIVPKLNEALANTPIPFSTPVPTVLATSCENNGAWLGTDGIGELPSGCTAIGDVMVNGSKFYDSGNGESTVVINLSSKTVSIYAQWGASLLANTNQEKLIEGELQHGCGDHCSRVRVVTVKDSGITQEFFNAAPKQ